MQGAVQATEEEQFELKQDGVAVTLQETDDYSKLTVTSGNVTVTPETIIVDDRFAYVSFSIKGYILGQGAEPSFESEQAYIGEDSNSSSINTISSFYDGIISDETGSPVYADGTPLKYTEDGNLIRTYADEEGNLEYVVRVSVANYTDSLLGQTLHVNFENLGTVYHAEYTGALEGCWDFTIDLPDSKSTTTISVEKNVDGTNFVLNSISW